MKGAKKPEESAGEKVPIWIISFADMITLLLSFFVMLQTMSHKREPELFHAGQGSFIRAIEGFGVPDLLFGKQQAAPLDYRRIKYPTAASPDRHPMNRVIDADDERIRQAFKELQERFANEASDISDRIIDFSATPVRFGRSQATLSARAQEHLKGFADNLKQNLALHKLRLYAIGLAADEGPGKGQWVLSARRAHAAEDFLRTELSEELSRAGWEIRSWGAGAGGSWCGKLGTSPEETFIVMAITEVSK
jgi:outer membrane protein OmpA-like peptidoglycan-associated protein